MKTLPMLWIIILLIVFGCEDIQRELKDDIGPSFFSGKPAILKISNNSYILSKKGGGVFPV